MRLSRALLMILGIPLGFALTTKTTQAQPKRFDDIKLTSKLDIDINEMKKGEVRPNRKTLDEFMGYFAEKLQHPDMFKPAQEFGSTILPMESTLNLFAARVLVPEPGNKYNINQAEYITDFGQSFVATFKPIIERSEPIIRLNAARFMASAAACGAPAFGPLVTELISNPNTPAEVKVWAFKAAEALLAAHDIVKLAGNTPRDHSLKTAELAALLKVLETNIYDPTKFVTFPQGVNPKDPPPELGAVVSYIRRQAIRAYSRVRFASIDDNGKTLKPAMVLAKIAMSDPALSPPPGPAEVAEAVIGLCSLQPDSSMMMDAVADAVATGLLTFASVLNNPSADSVIKTTPWKLYSARLRQALTAWKTIVANGSIPANRNPQFVPQVADAAIETIVNPLESGGAAGKVGMNLQKFDSLRKSLRGTAGYSKELFRGDASTSLSKFQK